MPNTATAPARFDIRSMTVGRTVEYGPITTRGVELAIGPAAHRGYVLVTDGHGAPFEALAVQLVAA